MSAWKRERYAYIHVTIAKGVVVDMNHMTKVTLT